MKARVVRGVADSMRLPLLLDVGRQDYNILTQWVNAAYITWPYDWSFSDYHLFSRPDGCTA